jgi:hypothetical protein
MIEGFLQILKEFGFPIALCVVLLLAIRFQNAQLQKAFAAMARAQADRIGVLEGIVTAQDQRIRGLEDDRLRRADEYAQSLRDVVTRYAAAVQEWHAWMDQAWRFLVSVARDDFARRRAPPPPPRQSGTDTGGET